MANPGTEHPDRDSLERYLAGELDREERRRLERHLVDCRHCHRQIEEADAHRRGAGGGESEAGTVLWRGHRFGERPAFERVSGEGAGELGDLLAELGNIVGYLAQHELEELLSEPEERRWERVREDRRLRSPDVLDLLAARCREGWFDDPRQAVELAKMAVLVSQQLDPALAGEDRVETHRELAWLHLGNAFRVVARLPGGRDAEPGSRLGDAREEAAGDHPDGGLYPAPRLAEHEVREAAAPGSVPSPPPALAAAEEALRETRDAYARRGRWVEAALVGLDLATVLVKQGRVREARAAGQELLARAEGGAGPEELAAALEPFAASEAPTLEELEEIAVDLYRLRNAPDVRFGED